MQASGALNSIKLDRILHPSRFNKIKKTEPGIDPQQQLRDFLSSQFVAPLTKRLNTHEHLTNQILLDFVVYSTMLLYGTGEDALTYMQKQSHNPYIPISPLLSITISTFIHTISTPDLMLLVFRAGGSVLEFLAKLALNIEREPHHDEKEELEHKREEESEKRREAAHDKEHHINPPIIQAPLWQAPLKSIVARTVAKSEGKPKAAKSVSKAGAAKSAKGAKVSGDKAAKVVAKTKEAKTTTTKANKTVAKSEKSSLKAFAKAKQSKLSTYMGNPDNPKQHPITAGLARFLLGKYHDGHTSSGEDSHNYEAPQAAPAA